MSSLPQEIQAAAAAHGALERLLACAHDHLDHATAVTAMNLRAAVVDAERVARLVAPHAVEPRDTMPSRVPSILTGQAPRAEGWKAGRNR